VSDQVGRQSTADTGEYTLYFRLIHSYDHLNQSGGWLPPLTRMGRNGVRSAEITSELPPSLCPQRSAQARRRCWFIADGRLHPETSSCPAVRRNRALHRRPADGLFRAMACSSGRVSSTESAKPSPPWMISLLVPSPNDHTPLFFLHASSCETYKSTGPSVHLRYICAGPGPIQKW